LPEIRHIFPGERKKISPIITILFLAAIVVSIGGYLVYIGQLDLNFGKFPDSFSGKISNLLFIFMILVLLGILVAFWIKINLFETLLYLSIAMIPALFIGNYALGSLQGKEKTD